MSVTMKTIRCLFVAALPLAALGCTQRTTSEDVQAAREDVREEQKDVADARHEAMKPAIDEKDAAKIQKEEKDVADAQANLAQKEKEATATQARDAFALNAQKVLDDANRQIEALEARVGNEQGAAKEATQQQINDLKTRRDRLDQAVDDMNGADLLKWSDHRDNVQLAMKELTDKLTTTR